ncbi:hypothetical protein D3C76_1035930 [compost metagenome]
MHHALTHPNLGGHAVLRQRSSVGDAVIAQRVNPGHDYQRWCQPRKVISLQRHRAGGVALSLIGKKALQ